MAELLVKAKTHWMDSLKQDDIDKMDEGKKRSYEARSQIGDVIVVRPDGWDWGKEECLPNFIVVKVPDMTIEEAKKYEESLMEKVIEKDLGGKDAEVMKMIKVRKYNIEKTVVDDVKATLGSHVEFTKTNILSKITEKAK